MVDTATTLSNKTLRPFSKESSTEQTPPRLPEELVRMVISHVCCLGDLESCSRTCRLWNQITFPRLHHSLTLTVPPTHDPRPNEWCKPLLALHQLSLLQYIQRLDIKSWEVAFTRKHLEPNRLYFAAFNNLQELSLYYLALPTFMPLVGGDFDHFAPTLQSLALFNPKASSRQMLCFIALFRHLRDLKLVRFTPTREDAETVNLLLLPRPPLDGWLTLAYIGFQEDDFVDTMITFYKRLRFRCVYLINVERAERVLRACAETMEKLEMGESCYDDSGKNIFR